MTTQLTRFQDAYATLTFAVYQPLTIRWISGSTIGLIADVMAPRVAKSQAVASSQEGGPAGVMPTAAALRLARASRLPDEIAGVEQAPDLPAVQPTDAQGRPLTADVQPIALAGYPDAAAVGGKVYPHGIVDALQPDRRFRSAILRRVTSMADQLAASSWRLSSGSVRSGVLSIPTVVNRRLGNVETRENVHAHRKDLFTNITSAVAANLDAADDVFADAVAGSMALNGTQLYEFLPVLTIREALSPIGIAHYYRQLYFNTSEGIGPIEEAFTIAPNETLEVMYESVRRQVHEELIEHGSETVSESAVESRDTDEVSDKTAAMVQRDSSVSMSAHASGSIGVYSGGASASANFAVSAQQSRELATKNLREVTTRASERITKSLTVRTRSLTDVTSTNVTRRVIQNLDTVPVSYGLRRVLRRVNVKVQELGPRLVWQLYLRNPGSGLARSRFVHFRESEPIAVPDVPPGVRPRPASGTDTGTANANLEYVNNAGYYARLRITTSGDRTVTGVTVDSVSDLEGGGKDDNAPAPRNEAPRNAHWDIASNTYSADVAIERGDSDAVAITYTYSYEPSAEAMAEWDAERAAAVAEITEDLLTAQFERERTLITEQSKIRPRPANDLRREERYEAMNRLVSSLFGRGDDPSEPTPLEIEYFHRYFDIDTMFVYMHPSWWKPRFTIGSDGFPRQSYEITASSDPAPLGRSLGWIIQLDGDTRRNEFLNSPWYRICLPIRAEREREAISWLAKHVEGDRGYDPSSEPLAGLLKAVEDHHDAEQGISPDWVTVSSSPGSPENPLSPEGIYPVVEQFDVTVPTEGFVYDALTMDGN